MPAHASRTLAPAPSAPPSGPERRLLAPAPPGERRHARRTLRQPGSPPLQASIGGFELKQQPLLLRLAARDLLGRLEARLDGEAVLREALLQQIRVDRALVVVVAAHLVGEDDGSACRRSVTRL